MYTRRHPPPNQLRAVSYRFETWNFYLFEDEDLHPSVLSFVHCIPSAAAIDIHLRPFISPKHLRAYQSPKCAESSMPMHFLSLVNLLSSFRFTWSAQIASSLSILLKCFPHDSLHLHVSSSIVARLPTLPNHSYPLSQAQIPHSLLDNATLPRCETTYS